jgi:hypothetical protein
MKFKGKIKELNDIIISDPSYGSNVPCRYENKNMDMKDVFVEMQFGTTDFEEDDDKNIHFFIIIKTDENECNLTDEREIKVLKNTKLKQYDIGVDTACFAMGINDYAKEIEEMRDEWQPECSIRTGTDGTIGSVIEGIRGNKLRFLLIISGVNKDFCSRNELFDYIKERFDIKKLKMEGLLLSGEQRNLSEGDKVEISECSITNDVGGTTTIRNSDYANLVAGYNITMEESDGTPYFQTVIEDTDSLVDIPIQAEIIKTYHSGKNWYRYMGKITDERLIKEFNKIGITGNDPEDYKKYPNKSLYESALKAREEYDPTIICFSEFDIVKLLEKNSDKEMEM